MNQPNPEQSLPILDSVDVLIFGGTLPAVVAALNAANSGLKVFLISGRSYLGEDLCGNLDLWPNDKKIPSHSALLKKLFPNLLPATPLHLKITLEQSLVEAGIPFIFNSYPTGILRNAQGAICGATLGNRAGRQIIEAKAVFDATLHSSVTQQAGITVTSLQGICPIHHVTLSNGEGLDAPNEKIIARPPQFTSHDPKNPWSLSPRIYELSVDFKEGTPLDLCRAQAEIVERTWTPSEFAHQENLNPINDPSARITSAADLHLKPGLLSLTCPYQNITCPYQNNARLPLNRIDPFLAARWVDLYFLEAWKLAQSSNTTGSSVTCAHSLPLPSGQIKTLANPLRNTPHSAQSLNINALNIPILGDFDVVVVGGGTAGAPAAIAAARMDAKTAVLELAPALGGVGTVGQIGRYWYGNRVGFTSEIDASVANLESVRKFQRGKGAWSISAKSEWYHRECYQNKVSIWFQSVCIGAWVVDNQVRGIVVASPLGYGLLKAKCVIDSTGCSDIPAAVGAPTTSIGSDHIAIQGTGLAGQIPNRDYHNSDHNFSDDTDIIDSTAFFVASKLKSKNDFDSGHLINSRERRQIIGDYTLDLIDFMNDHRFNDTICVASSNFDTHGFTVHPVFMIKPPHEDRLWVDVPFRALLPQGIERLIVTGLGVSAHRDVIPVIRMQPDVQNQGYAAGLIAAQSALENLDLRSLDIRSIQRELVRIGNLPPRVLTDQNPPPLDPARIHHAVLNDWDDFAGLALIFSAPDLATPLILEALKTAVPSEQKLRYAEILGFFRNPTGKPILEEAIESSQWDTGWNYIGMGQFGMSMSALDTRILALGLCGDRQSWNVLLLKIKSLSLDLSFSHCRALVTAAESLHQRHPCPEASEAFAQILAFPGISGHAHTSIHAVQVALSENLCDNDVRNQALIELHLARAIFNCGDFQQLGRKTLNEYANDYRGHFAKHAQSILAKAPVRSFPA